MLEKFQNHIDQNLPFLREGRLLIAISGGLDSVVLAYLCKKSKFNFALAHCNFNLRGTESDGDENFVMQLAKTLNVEVFIENFDTENYAKTHKLSTQMAARELRYNWFEKLKTQLNFNYVLTAHHTDDNLETFLINLSRGTGLDGLIGIPQINNHIVRPLLVFQRQVLEAFAKKQNMAWREDASNASTKYLRNKLRHEVIPILKGINPQLLQNFEKSIEHLQDSRSIIEDRIKEVSSQIISKRDDGNLKLSIDEIEKLNNSPAYLYELLKNYGFTEWHDVVGLLEAQSGKYILSRTHRLIKDRKHLLLSKKIKTERDSIEIQESDKEISISLGRLVFIKGYSDFEKGKNLIFLDLAKLKFPLTLRKWEKGDYFYPSGMTGKKKLSKYFKDERFSLLDKENTWLLCSGKDIIWIVNHRGDNRFVSNNASEYRLKIELK